MDKERFDKALEQASARSREGIGTLGEKGIHNTLKHYYEPDPACHEVAIGGFVADIVGENGIIEIQSAAFSRMKEKLTRFLECARVTVVWPCVVNKRIIRIDSQTGEIVSTRRSTVHRGEYDLFRELYSIRHLVPDPRLTVCIAQLDADEYRPDNQKRGRKHRGANNGTERYPTALTGEVVLSCPEDYLRFVPAGLPETFTASQFAKCACVSADIARMTLAVLVELGAAVRCGKVGRAFAYRLAETEFSENSPTGEHTSAAPQVSAAKPLDPDHISAIMQQPLEGLDGHMCIAILAGIPIADVLAESAVGRWQMSAKKLMEILSRFGVEHGGSLKRASKKVCTLPQCCIISEGGHFLLHYRGIYYDNIRGQSEYFDRSRMTGYIEIFTGE